MNCIPNKKNRSPARLSLAIAVAAVLIAPSAWAAIITVTKTFNPAAISVGGTSILTITITNPNSVPITGLAFKDNYPNGLAHAAVPSLSNTCGGTANAGSSEGNVLRLSGGSLPANSSCAVSVNVTSASTGSYVNDVGKVSSDNADDAYAAPATLVVTAAGAGRFNACDVGTTCTNSTPSTYIKTRIAGTAFSLDLVALKADGSRDTGYNKTVTVQLLDGSDSSGALDSGKCRSTWTVIATLSPSPKFRASDNGLKTVGTFTVANAYRNVRVRVTEGSKIGCSTDIFAIRPAAFAGMSVTDGDWQTAGTARALGNTAASGGNVHKAGQPFTLQATAQNSAAATTTFYAGTPAAVACAGATPVCNAAGGLLPAGTSACSGTACIGTPGVMTPGAAVAGVINSTAATYSEVGAFTLQLQDQTFADADSGDGTPADCTGRYVCSATLNIGRFVPDHFDVAGLVAPTFKTFNAADAACSAGAAPRRTFGYVGQPFGYLTAPQATILARNASGATTANYSGALWKLINTDVSQTYGYTLTPASTPGLTTAIGLPVMVSNSDGTGTVTANSSDMLTFNRAATPQAIFTANITNTVSVQDASEAVGNGTITTTTPLVFNGGGTGIAFDAGNEFRYGRLKLSNAHGSELLDLSVPLVAQYWNGTAAAFVTNTADHCTTVAAPSPTLTPGGSAVAATLGNSPFAGGDGGLRLAKPGAKGYATVTVDAPAWLEYPWTGAGLTDPVSRATFGVYKGNNEFIYLRETY